MMWRKVSGYDEVSTRACINTQIITNQSRGERDGRYLRMSNDTEDDAEETLRRIDRAIRRLNPALPAARDTQESRKPRRQSSRIGREHGSYTRECQQTIQRYLPEYTQKTFNTGSTTHQSPSDIYLWSELVSILVYKNRDKWNQKQGCQLLNLLYRLYSIVSSSYSSCPERPRSATTTCPASRGHRLSEGRTGSVESYFHEGDKRRALKYVNPEKARRKRKGDLRYDLNSRQHGCIYERTHSTTTNPPTRAPRIVLADLVRVLKAEREAVKRKEQQRINRQIAHCWANTSFNRLLPFWQEAPTHQETIKPNTSISSLIKSPIDHPEGNLIEAHQSTDHQPRAPLRAAILSDETGTHKQTPENVFGSSLSSLVLPPVDHHHKPKTIEARHLPLGTKNRRALDRRIYYTPEQPQQNQNLPARDDPPKLSQFDLDPVIVLQSHEGKTKKPIRDTDNRHHYKTETKQSDRDRRHKRKRHKRDFLTDSSNNNKIKPCTEAPPRRPSKIISVNRALDRAANLKRIVNNVKIARKELAEKNRRKQDTRKNGEKKQRTSKNDNKEARWSSKKKDRDKVKAKEKEAKEDKDKRTTVRSEPVLRRQDKKAQQIKKHKRKEIAPPVTSTVDRQEGRRTQLLETQPHDSVCTLDLIMAARKHNHNHRRGGDEVLSHLMKVYRAVAEGRLNTNTKMKINMKADEAHEVEVVKSARIIANCLESSPSKRQLVHREWRRICKAHSSSNNHNNNNFILIPQHHPLKPSPLFSIRNKND